MPDRGEGSIGQVLAASLGGGVWQQPRLVNERFLALMEVEPLGKSHAPRLAELWQIRHVIVHNTGVVTPFDAHRLNDATLAGKALRIDLDFLDDIESELVDILTEGCTRIEERIICDSKEQLSKGAVTEEEVIPLLVATQVAAKTKPVESPTPDDVATRLKGHTCDRC